MNLLLSHPDVCKPRGETHQVFRGKRHLLPVEPLSVYFSKLWNYLPILIVQRQDVFSIDRWEPRRELSSKIMTRIDQILFRDKLKALGPTQNLYKTEGMKYSLEEIRNSRLICKNLNGLIFMTDQLHRMYPDATFIALVRNGFALCEGHIRRGTHSARIAKLYEEGCRKIISDSKSIKNYHIFRYEDLLNEPLDTLKRIYECADLDVNQVSKIRLVTVKVITGDGKHEYVHGTDREELIWYDLEDFGRHLHSDVNENQIRRLTEEQKQIILGHARDILEYFSYI